MRGVVYALVTDKGGDLLRFKDLVSHFFSYGPMRSHAVSRTPCSPMHPGPMQAPHAAPCGPMQWHFQQHLGLGIRNLPSVLDAGWEE